jgi:hypothetical protein
MNNIIVKENEIDDYTSEGPWTINNETYNKIDITLSKGDGETYDIVVQRKSDNKYFQFSYSIDGGAYYYGERWCEVTPHIIKKTQWKVK